jgi:hypothetical protein
VGQDVPLIQNLLVIGPNIKTLTEELKLNPNAREMSAVPEVLFTLNEDSILSE